MVFSSTRNARGCTPAGYAGCLYLGRSRSLKAAQAGQVSPRQSLRIISGVSKIGALALSERRLFALVAARIKVMFFQMARLRHGTVIV